jgi:ATP-dependent protease ClpP protease subunit
MNDEMKMFPMMQTRRVITRTFTNQSTEYTIRITRPITEIDDFEEEIMALEEATEDDVVMIQLSSPGGSLETCDFLCRRIQECKALVFVEIGLTCASAASAICLQADDWKIHDSSTIMVHACSYSPGWGKEVDVFSSATYTNRVNREWVERTYKGFLSEIELQSVLDGKDLYFYADDLRERLPKYMKYRMELAESQCTCGQCGVDNDLEDTEGGFDLKDLIKQAVNEALAEREAVKATDKPAKRPSSRAKKPADDEIVVK